MRKKIAFPLFTILISFYGCGGGSTGSKPADAKTIFSENCVLCHGDDGKAGIMGSSDLSISKMDDEMMSSIIKNGKGRMTGFSTVLNDEQVKMVIDYIKTLRK